MANKVRLGFKKLTEDAKIPSYSHPGDSGMDISTIDECLILPHSFVKLRTGIAAEIPEGYELQVRPRSGLQCKWGIVGAWGTVDGPYKGDIGIALYNHGDDPFVIHKGDRVAQLVLAPVTIAEIEEITELTDSERGDKGFGSSGLQ